MEICETPATIGTEEAPGKRAAANGVTSAETSQGLTTDTTTASFANAATRTAAVLATWAVADPKSLQLIERAQKLAQTATTILLRGESGTGKGLLASIIHHIGPNADGPLVQIDCASLPAILAENELLGCEHGAFRASIKHGLLEMAAGGNLVLDEIAALSMPLQAKLLRLIEEKTFRRVGGNRSVPVEARILALTSIDLERAVARRTFREDLYYRLNTFSAVIPPLRSRPADIAPLANHLVAQLCEIHRKPRLSISPQTMAALEHYSFPGNVRELRTLLERAIIQRRSVEIGLEDLPLQVREAASAETKKMSLEQLERLYIAEILEHTHGKKTKAAQILGISRKTLLEKRKRYGLN